MYNLLSNSHRRRLKLLEEISKQTDWITLGKLGKILDCSQRVLKNDLQFFKENYSDFSIITSQKGLQIQFETGKGLRSIYSNSLDTSPNFQLLEALFLNEHYSIEDIESLFYMSIATIYRMINVINEILEAHSFKIETSPFQIIGKEENIRYFYYQYFYEKYSNFDWPYCGLDEEAIDDLLNLFLGFTNVSIDFGTYNAFKTVSAVNIIRYKNGHFIDTSGIKSNFDQLIPDLAHYIDLFTEIEERLGVKIDETFIEQVFSGYTDINYSISEESLRNKAKQNKKIAAHQTYLENMFDALSKKSHIPIINKSELIFMTMNMSHLEYKSPLSGYILYNRNRQFIQKMKSEIPHFYQILYNTVMAYRKFLGKPLNEDGITYYMYTIFTAWENLVPEIVEKMGKISLIIISDRHTSHARMWRDMLEYSFTKQLSIDIYQSSELNQKILTELDYDIILTTFPMDELKSKLTIYIESFPTYTHNLQIQEVIDQINIERGY